MTQISYGSTAIELSDKLNYPRFFRTCSSDKHQAEALADIIKMYKWKKVRRKKTTHVRWQLSKYFARIVFQRDWRDPLKVNIFVHLTHPLRWLGASCWPRGFLDWSEKWYLESGKDPTRWYLGLTTPSGQLAPSHQ